MIHVAISVAVLLGAADSCSVSGRVLDVQGDALAGAQVFLEQSLEGPVLMTHADADGRYRFDSVRQGRVGVFARAAALAWGGTSVSLGYGQSLSGVDLRLRAPDTVSGHAYAGKNAPVQGVRVTRIALINSSVSIPFSKLRGFGIGEPVTNSSGEYTVEHIPRGETLALKLAHPSFAQARIDEARAGSTNADVTLYEGVLVTGRVLATGTKRPVSEALVSIRNANPPHDTATAVTDNQGEFGVRLMPGAYMYKAGGARFESAGWKALTLTGELPIKQLEMYVAGASEVTGKVLDAKSGDPIEGARIYLTTDGAPAAMARTGPSGEYLLQAMAGENTVRLEPAPGYLPPTTPGTRFTVPEGERYELPSFWLAPLPRYVLRVIGDDDQPAAGAVIRLLRPTQIGWQVADSAGEAQLGFLNLPADGRVVGLVEHRERAEAAVFSIAPDHSGDAVVQLLPTAAASGRVTDSSGRGLEGVVVDGRLLDESMDDPVLIWRTVTNADGEYAAPVVPAQVAHVVQAYAVDDWGAMGAQGRPRTFVAEPDAVKRVGDIVVEVAQGGRSLLGERLRWSGGRTLCGPEPPARSTSSAAIVQYCSPAEAEATIAGLEAAAELLGSRYHYGVVIDGNTECSATRVSVLSGTRPATASTYVLNDSGEVALETFGLPPLKALR